MSVKETLKQLESEKTKVLMAELYGAEKAEENRARYRTDRSGKGACRK